jgi:hypothetical protein
MRRDEKPILLEIVTSKAAASEVFQLRKAGPELFLTVDVPVEHILFPLLRQDALFRREIKPKKEREAEATKIPTHGSFFPDIHSIFGSEGDQAAAKSGKSKARRGAEWKRDSRKERGKRGY